MEKGVCTGINQKKHRLTPIKCLERKTRIELYVAYALEICLSLAGIALVAYFYAIGDPSHRAMSSIGLIAVGFVPFIFELIIGRRLSIPMHFIYFVHMVCSSLLGSALMFHEAVPMYDKVMHFFLGFWCCVYMYCFMRSIDNLKPWTSAFSFFMISMGFAALWECVIEFTMNIFFGQTALGIVKDDAIKAIIAEKTQGLNGVASNFTELKYIGVDDTLTDMIAHMLGSLVFLTLYMFNRVKGKNLGVGWFRNEYINNRANRPVPGETGCGDTAACEQSADGGNAAK